MYRPAAYAIDDVSVLHAFARQRVFAIVAAIVAGRVQFAYAPVIVDTEPPPFGTARFHLARSNPLAELPDQEMRVLFLGPDAYVSPDWYEGKGFVPTWNYIAVEGSGRARTLDKNELRRLLIELSSAHEELLHPKAPWTLGEISETRLTALMETICGFAIALHTLEGKFKLSQDKSPADVAGVISGLENRADAASLAVARAMKFQAASR